jgi:two-component system, LuxR family, response regulator FixJ
MELSMQTIEHSNERRIEPTVYLVDDDAAVRDALCLLIRSVKLNVVAYGDPADFLRDFKGDEVGCLVIDIRMPVLNGFAVQERLQAAKSALPIIFITGHGDLAQCRRAFQNGAIDFLTKPVDEHALLESLQKAIRLSEESSFTHHRGTEARNAISKLSSRERAVFDLLSEGLANKVIADKLRLSLRTVEAYRASVIEKTNASSIADIVRLQILAAQLERLP